MRIDRVLVAVLLLVLVGLTSGVLVAQSQEEIDLEKGLVAHWAFDEGEGDIAFDGTENHNDGTLKCVGEECSPPEWVEGKIGYALEFDGTDDYVDCGGDSSLEMGTGDFTIAAWVKTSSSDSGWPRIVRKVGDDYGYEFYLHQDYHSLCLALHDGTRHWLYSLGSALNDDQWHHVAVVANRDGNLTFYVDGIQDGGTPDISSIGDVGNMCNLTISNPATSFNGFIDEVYIYNRALNTDEITAHYLRGV